MWRYLIGGALAAFSMHGGAYAAPASLAADAAEFGARENAAQVALSPSGNRVVMLVAGQGRSTIARVVDLQSGDIRDLIVSRATPEALDWCNFATDAQLVCQYGGNVDMTGQIVSFSRLVTVGADGKLIRPLGQSASAYDANIRQSDGKILDWLDEGGGHVLMQRNYVAETGRTGSNIVRKKDGLGVDKIDLSSLKVVQVESPNRVIANYMTDGRGQIRIRRIDEANTDGILNGVRNFSFRRLGSKQWEPLGSHDARDDSGLYPLAIEADSNSVFVLRKLNGRDALYRVSLDGMATTILVAKNPAVDIDGVTRFGRGQRVIGYTYADDRRRTVYFDTEFQKLASSLGRALPNAPILDFVSASADGSKLLVFAGSDTLPGTYYLLNRKTRELSPLADVRPPLADRPLSPVKSVFYTARDGASIPAYLTVPAGSDAKNLPAIVLPHGGPSARDEWGFDWLAQFLASRGYAVIQPNFRGSAGYGDDFENGNGFRNWRTSIADVGDAGRYLVKEGIADKGRMAVVGWSYGEIGRAHV